MALTTLQIEHAGKPGSKLGAGKHHDGDGLYLEVRKATSKSWTGRHTIAGKEVWLGLGSARDISLKRARDLHAENRRLVAEGIDPRAHRKAAAAAEAMEAARSIVFKDAAEKFIDKHEAGWRNEKHRRDWRNSLKTYAFPIIGDLTMQVLNITTAMKVFDQPVDGEKFWLARPETADRVRGRCEQIWDAAKVQGRCSGENPFRWALLKHLLPARSKIQPVRHHAAVPWREIPAVVAALQARTSISARALEFTILTVPRSGELLEARWTEFDLDNAVWTVPGSRMKAGREHRVPLAGRALEIIRARKDDAPPDELVWDLTGAALSKMLALLGRTETVHGLRSSFRDWVAEATTFQRELAEAALAHVIGNEVERAYQRGDLFDKRRRLMEAWAKYCESAPVDAADNVVTRRSA